MKKLLFGLLIAGMVIFAAAPAMAADNDDMNLAGENIGVFEAYADMPNLSFEEPVASVMRAQSAYMSYIDMYGNSSLVGAERDYTRSKFYIDVTPSHWNSSNPGSSPTSTSQCRLLVKVGTKSLFGMTTKVSADMYMWETGVEYTQRIGDAGIEDGIVYGFNTYSYGIYAPVQMYCLR